MEAYSIPKAKWPAELRAYLNDEALATYTTVSPADINNYDKIKTAILLREESLRQTECKRLLQMQPRLGQTAAQVYGHITDTLMQFSEGMTLQQFIKLFSLEVVYRLSVPLIGASVQALQRPQPEQSIHELDQHSITRGM